MFWLQENLILMKKNVEEVFNKCSTDQSCIRKRNTTYKIGTLKCNFFFSSSHERKKKYWEQLELRCRHLYRRPPPPHGLGNHGNHINSSMLVTPGSQCGYCTTTTGKEFHENPFEYQKNHFLGLIAVFW